MTMSAHKEIERKYLIFYPSEMLLAEKEGVRKIEMIQTYLRTSIKGDSRRVRSSTENGKTVFTYTQKKRETSLTRQETETVIDETAYRNLLCEADTDCAVIRKTRYAVPANGVVYEFDLYPFWTKYAVMEIELESEAQEIIFPDFVSVCRELTDDLAFTNHSIARALLHNKLPI